MSLYPSIPHGARRTCRLYWCYQCRRSVRIVSSQASDIFCPRCYGRFLHEIDFPRPQLPLHHDPLCPFHRPFGHGGAEFEGLRRRPIPEDRAGDLSSPWVIFGRTAEEFPPHPGPRRPPPPAPRRPEGAIPPAVDPGDYFTGPNLNELIEDLTQNDRPGPPPAQRSSIDAMPTVSITQAHLVDGSQCPVCKEEFELGEEAREMPCKHVYHSDCIVPWLSIHNSCPVCRYQLPGNSNGTRPRSSGEEHRRGGGSRGRGPARWSPFSMLWPFRDPSPGWEYDYRSPAESDNIRDSPGETTQVFSNEMEEYPARFREAGQAITQYFIILMASGFKEEPYT